MLLSQVSIAGEDFNQNSHQSRLEELIARYEDPVRAIVHRTLEEYVERSFAEFMEGKIGAKIPRASDGELVTEYRNGNSEVDPIVKTVFLRNKIDTHAA